MNYQYSTIDIRGVKVNNKHKETEPETSFLMARRTLEAARQFANKHFDEDFIVWVLADGLSVWLAKAYCILEFTDKHFAEVKHRIKIDDISDWWRCYCLFATVSSLQAVLTNTTRAIYNIAKDQIREGV